MKRLRRRPELLLAAAALLVAAAVLLAAGAKSALDRPAPLPEEPSSLMNPFEAAQPGAPDTTAGAEASYVVGYTGVVIVQPGGNEPPAQPGGSAPVVQPPLQAAAPPQQTPQPQPSYPVNLNTATQAQLETLPGIGPVKAQAILAWRAAHGAFTNASQLIEVNGIGQKTLENMLPYITW